MTDRVDASISQLSSTWNQSCRVFYMVFLEGSLVWLSPSFLTVVTSLTHLYSVFFPSLFYFSHPHHIPGIISQINYTCPNFCLWVCFGGIQTKAGGFGEEPSWNSEPLSAVSAPDSQHKHLCKVGEVAGKGAWLGILVTHGLICMVVMLISFCVSKNAQIIRTQRRWAFTPKQSWCGQIYKCWPWGPQARKMWLDWDLPLAWLFHFLLGTGFLLSRTLVGPFVCRSVWEWTSTLLPLWGGVCFYFVITFWNYFLNR